MELLKTDTLLQAKEKLKQKTKDWHFKTKILSLNQANGKTIAQDIVCSRNVPPFARSTMDGYAIIAQDSYGASASNPIFFEVIDHVNIDEVATKEIHEHEAIQVQTGSMLPLNATAVVMKEYIESYAKDKIVVMKAVSVGENIIQKGEDMKQGEILVPKGKKLTFSDLGILASQGIQEVEVFQPLTMTIISTGDELVDLDEPLVGAHIYDVNSYALQALACENDFCVINRTLIADDQQLLLEACQQAIKESDCLVMSGGSSKGKKDYTRQIFEELGGEVFTHGIAIKPGKPTILGIKDHTLLIGLPGNPLAALLIFKLILVDWFEQCKKMARKPLLNAKIQENVSNNQGRSTCCFVRLVQHDHELWAYPLYTKSANISILSKADGFTIIPSTQEGVKQGSWIEVEML